MEAQAHGAPYMGLGFLPEPMLSRELGSDGSSSPGSLGVIKLELPHPSSLFLGPLLYFGLGIPSLNPRDVLFGLISEAFFLSIF